MAMNKEQFNNDMNALSNAINEKTGGTEPMTISEMVNAVKSISSGGGGGAVEACTVTITYIFSPGASSNTLTYTTPEIMYETLTVNADQTYTIQCAKNTIMGFKTVVPSSEEGNISYVGLGSYLVTGDGTIEMG